MEPRCIFCERIRERWDIYRLLITIPDFIAIKLSEMTTLWFTNCILLLQMTSLSNSVWVRVG